MNTKDLSRYPPATHALRPERQYHRMNFLEKTFHVIAGVPIRLFRTRLERFSGILPLVHRHASELAGLTDAQLKGRARELGTGMRKGGLTDPLVAETFALVREAAGRTLGMKHFDCQLIGGNVILKGMVAEMDTGEGKTLTATLAASAAALAGIPVHVISVNDYLTARDAETMGPVYKALGLTVGCVIHEADTAKRRREYMCDITYCTNKELVFDYLRDRIMLGDRSEALKLHAEHLSGEKKRVNDVVLRGLHFGIVDEADSILIDEARTPLLISRKTGGEEEKHFMKQALDIAKKLEQGKDYTVDIGKRTIILTAGGRDRLNDSVKALGPLWTGLVRREETVSQALSALHLFRVNEHYMVRENKVEIVDEFTGRAMPDRSWERGLHQLIELKEGCEMTQKHETEARISYQRFFRKYMHMAGMTGTAKEVSGEMWSVYGLPVVRIPTNRPVKRTHYPDTVFPSDGEKWEAVTRRIGELHAEGRPLLIGTRTINTSEHLSGLLDAAGLKHQVLNAWHEREEAEIVAKAGEYGKITIATNMAGRGTDIKLEPGVVARNGLHVILTEFHEAKRIDRQLIGRCGRQGDPGSYQAILSLEDPLIKAGQAQSAATLAGFLMRSHKKAGRWLGMQALRRAQMRVERFHARIRRQLLKSDEKLGETLSFSGKIE